MWQNRSGPCSEPARFSDLEAGQKVLITTLDGMYEGIVDTVDLDTDKLFLKKVFSSGTHFSGVMTFFEGEILEGEILKDNKSGSGKSNESHIHPLTDIPYHAEQQMAPRGDYDHNDQMTRVGAKESESNAPSKKYETYGHHEREEVNHVIIESLDSEFERAIAFISKQRKIGLGAEGVNLGRSGKLCWLQISCASCVFFFDMMRSAEDFISHGLKCILEDSNIIKVVHDCRFLSDALHHCYSTKMMNVYDTQVADVLVYKLFNGGNLPRYVNGLHNCLVEHLHLDASNVYFPRVREAMKYEDQCVWKKRPLPSHLIGAAMKNVMYLLELHDVLSQKLFLELKHGVDIYLGVVRDAKQEDVAVMSSHLLPSAFQGLASHNYRRVPRHRGNHEHEVFDHFGFSNNHVHIYDPNMVYSRDSWNNYRRGGKDGRKFKQGDKKSAEKKKGTPTTPPANGTEKADANASPSTGDPVKEKTADAPPTKLGITPAGLMLPNASKAMIRRGEAQRQHANVAPPLSSENKAVPGMGRGCFLKKLTGA